MKNLLKLTLSALISLVITIPACAYPDVTADHWAAKQIKDLTEKELLLVILTEVFSLMITLHVQNLHQWQ